MTLLSYCVEQSTTPSLAVGFISLAGTLMIIGLIVIGGAAITGKFRD